MEIDGQVTISLKTFNQLQDRAKQADELKKKMQDLQEEITDISDSHADVKNASRKVLEQITITIKAEEE